MDRKEWAARYHYREAKAVDSCDVCSYANRIDTDGDTLIESLTCAAATEDTGAPFSVDFGNICDLFLPEMMEEED